MNISFQYHENDEGWWTGWVRLIFNWDTDDEYPDESMKVEFEVDDWSRFVKTIDEFDEIIMALPRANEG
jgi:hypothetical protein